MTKINFNRFVSLILSAVMLLAPSAFAADSSVASLSLGGVVPQVFSVNTRGVAGDIDLSPNVVVNNRRIGLLHFKYNINVASITVSSSTASGAPTSGSGSTYGFQGGGFKVSIGAGCASVDPTYNTPFILTGAGTDVKSAASTALVTGVEEDCEVNASWVGTSAHLPLAGVYAMTINVTMTSN